MLIVSVPERSLQRLRRTKYRPLPHQGVPNVWDGRRKSTLALNDASVSSTKSSDIDLDHAEWLSRVCTALWLLPGYVKKGLITQVSSR